MGNTKVSALNMLNIATTNQSYDVIKQLQEESCHPPEKFTDLPSDDEDIEMVTTELDTTNKHSFSVVDGKK